MIINIAYYFIRVCYPKPSCYFCGQHKTPCSKLHEQENEHKKSADGFICHLCDHQFTSNKSLITHFKQHQNRKHLRQPHKKPLLKIKPKRIQMKKHECSKCFQRFKSKLALRVHMRTHLPIKKQMKTCPTCNKTFINA